MEPRRNSSSNSSQPQPSTVLKTRKEGGGGINILNTILVVLLIITSVVATAYLILRLNTDAGSQSAVKSKQYQALFLTNGQVYFGHLTNVDKGYVLLTDIYYLQVQQTVQPSSSSSSSNNQQVSLAKLGNELHGPEDAMYVAHDQVLFWENLKNSGKVVQAITAYQSSHPGTN
ncbi:MAG TPA: hypothetical protein VMR75_01880 [Candidatus Saccharimonadales bacterium]|nr:hypothetical protein [Candidatus Saccharimonadales bacterium]